MGNIKCIDFQMPKGKVLLYKMDLNEKFKISKNKKLNKKKKKIQKNISVYTKYL